jgi:hypothetical protein
VTLLSVFIALVVVGFVLWAINHFVPMDANVKKLLNIAVIIILVIWLLKASGLLSTLGSVTV